MKLIKKTEVKLKKRETSDCSKIDNLAFKKAIPLEQSVNFDDIVLELKFAKYPVGFHLCCFEEISEHEKIVLGKDKYGGSFFCYFENPVTLYGKNKKYNFKLVFSEVFKSEDDSDFLIYKIAIIPDIKEVNYDIAVFKVIKENDLSKYVKEVLTFKTDKTSYKERIGEPDEFSSVIGLITLSFQQLEANLSKFIILMLDIDIEKGKIIIDALSFTNKINMFSSLFHLLKDTKSFSYGKFDKNLYFKELEKSILKCQDLRNEVIHSNLQKNNVEKTEVSYLFDISDFMLSISMEVDNFFIGFADNVN